MLVVRAGVDRATARLADRLRHNLFAPADRLVDSGEPFLIVRNGVRLRRIREEAWVAARPLSIRVRDPKPLG